MGGSSPKFGGGLQQQCKGGHHRGVPTVLDVTQDFETCHEGQGTVSCEDQVNAGGARAAA
jgi:hypothetical protein